MSHRYISDSHRLAHPFADELSSFLAKRPKVLAQYLEIVEGSKRARRNLPTMKQSSVEAWNVASIEIAIVEHITKLEYLKRAGASKNVLAIEHNFIKQLKGRLEAAKAKLAAN